jgi:hypothetical protein
MVKKLFTQGDDWDTFYQQEILAECANHKLPVAPVVEEGTTTQVDDVFPPVLPPTPNPNPDPMPGPDTTVPPPPVAPPVTPPTPTPTYTAPFGWPWTPPDGCAPNTLPTNPHEKPDIDPTLYHWGLETYFDFGYYYWFDRPSLSEAEKTWSLKVLWADAYYYLEANPGPYKYISRWDEPQFPLDSGGTPGLVHQANWDFEGDFDKPYSHYASEHQAPKPGTWLGVTVRVWFNQALPN